MVGRLPDFLIIGAYKCGTTSLVDYLGQHPDIHLPWLQEPNYFAYETDSESTQLKPEVDWGSLYRRHRARTLAQYQTLFDDAPASSVVGECSPEYMRSPHAWRRIKATVPSVRLIAILRNPAERAHSDYQAFVRDGLEQEPFSSTIQRSRSTEPGHQYVTTGFYGAQLRPYFEAFDREQLRVVLMDDLRQDGAAVVRDLCSWLGVDVSGWAPDLSVTRNVSGRPGNVAVAAAFRARRRLRPWIKPLVPPRLQRRADDLLASGLRRDALPADAKKQLLEIYHDDIRLLEQLLERDLSPWLR